MKYWIPALLSVAAMSALAQSDPAVNPALPENAAVSTPVGPAAAPDNRARIDSMLIHALSLIGVMYRYGGNNAHEGFDCSGFVRHVFAEALSTELPRSALAMSNMGLNVDRDALLPGDLVFYNTLRRRFSHVAIYLGEGRFVHAPSRGKAVEIVDMSDRYWAKRYNGARRLVEQD